IKLFVYIILSISCVYANSHDSKLKNIILNDKNIITKIEDLEYKNVSIKGHSLGGGISNYLNKNDEILLKGHSLGGGISNYFIKNTELQGHSLGGGISNLFSESQLINENN
ncbi:hypothetical protein, partial [Oceanivirga salmonicida]